MSDDLKTRLRTWDDQQPPFRIMREAANRIEMLEAEIARLKSKQHITVSWEIPAQTYANGWMPIK